MVRTGYGQRQVGTQWSRSGIGLCQSRVLYQQITYLFIYIDEYSPEGHFPPRVTLCPTPVFRPTVCPMSNSIDLVDVTKNFQSTVEEGSRMVWSRMFHDGVPVVPGGVGFMWSLLISHHYF